MANIILANEIWSVQKTKVQILPGGNKNWLVSTLLCSTIYACWKFQKVVRNSKKIFEKSLSITQVSFVLKSDKSNCH